jgi:hypothetical protein
MLLVLGAAVHAQFGCFDSPVIPKGWKGKAVASVQAPRQRRKAGDQQPAISCWEENEWRSIRASCRPWSPFVFLPGNDIDSLGYKAEPLGYRRLKGQDRAAQTPLAGSSPISKENR